MVFFPATVLSKALLVMMAFQPATGAPTCDGAGECIAHANRAFTAGQSVEGIETLVQGFDLAWEGDVAVMAEAVLYRCANHQPEQDDDGFLAVCAAFLDSRHDGLSKSTNPDLLEVLAATKERLQWEEKGEAAPPPECPSPTLEPKVSPPTPTQSPVHVDSNPSEGSGRLDRRSAWLFGVASASAAASVPLLVIGSKVIVDAHETRNAAFQSDRFLTANEADRAVFVAAFDQYVTERRLGGGLMLGAGSLLVVGSAVMFTVAATHPWDRGPERKRSVAGGLALAFLGMRAGGGLAVRGRF